MAMKYIVDKENLKWKCYLALNCYTSGAGSTINYCDENSI